MTLILALECADGLVLASDSQSTYSTNGQHVKASVEKIYCPWTNMAWGGSGHVGIIQRVQQELGKRYSRPNEFESMHPNDVRRRLAEVVAQVVRPLLQEQVLQVPGQPPPLTTFLFVGKTRGGPFLLEIGTDLSDVDHSEMGYVAIGSGDIFPYFALAGLAHFDIRNRSLPEAKAVAYRVMEDAINVAASGLGPPIQMIEITKPSSGPGVAHQLTEDELRMLADSVLGWKSLESEMLADCLGIAPAPS